MLVYNTWRHCHLLRPLILIGALGWKMSVQIVLEVWRAEGILLWVVVFKWGARLEHWESLTPLTKLLYKCFESTDRGVVWLVSLMALMVLDLYGGYKITDDGVQCLAPLTSVTRLGLCHCNKITDKGTSYLVGLIGLKKLILNGCLKLTDVEIRNLDSLTALTHLRVNFCENITNATIRHLELQFQ